jgi:hypothetical protein
MLNGSSISSNSMSNRTSVLKTIFDTKFTSLRLWFQNTDLTNDYNNMPNNEDIEQIINQEFITILNDWLGDSSKHFQSIELKNTSNQNQISGYVIILSFLHWDIQ